MQNVQFLESVHLLMLFKQVVGEFLIQTIFSVGFAVVCVAKTQITSRGRYMIEPYSEKYQII